MRAKIIITFYESADAGGEIFLAWSAKSAVPWLYLTRYNEGGVSLFNALLFYLSYRRQHMESPQYETSKNRRETTDVDGVLKVKRDYRIVALIVTLCIILWRPAMAWRSFLPVGYVRNWHQYDSSPRR